MDKLAKKTNSADSNRKVTPPEPVVNSVHNTGEKAFKAKHSAKDKEFMDTLPESVNSDKNHHHHHHEEEGDFGYKTPVQREGVHANLV